MKYAWFVNLLFSLQISCHNLPAVQNRIYNELSLPIKVKLLKDYQQQTSPATFRRVGIEAYRMKDADTEPVDRTTDTRDDSNMKMKLFRLMYETIRDSDIKIKRAEVIKKRYMNSTTFNIGYIVGEITDRYNVMTDIAVTMQRLYHEWKPMEHINAYEQIANKAVELSHLVDDARNMAKKDPVYRARYKKKV